MFSHIVVGSNDIKASRRFYDAIFAALGGPKATPVTDDRFMYMKDGAVFLVTKPVNGEPACHANGGTIGFAVASTEMADAWHAAGVANGGIACEDPPGVRVNSFGRLYLAYLRDPAGNKLCAFFPLG